jgi:hypothetical protein
MKLTFRSITSIFLILSVSFYILTTAIYMKNMRSYKASLCRVSTERDSFNLENVINELKNDKQKRRMK